MNRKDLQILYTALGYVVACLKEPESPEKAEPAMILAAHIEEYCRRHVQDAFPANEIRFVNDYGAEAIDEAIDRHVKELRLREEANLPQDRETLIKFFDRLKQRKERRLHAFFLETANTEIIANTVLKYMDEEIHELELDS